MGDHDPFDTGQNPFCAARLRPRAGAFLFATGHSIDQLVEQLRRAAWWGQILGPHGSGKSTLLDSLLSAIERSGRTTQVAVLHDAQRRLPPEFHAAVDSQRPNLLAIDGYEQLSPWNRFLLKRMCRRRGLGLVVTSHRPMGLPDLFHTSVDVPLAWRVVEQLQRDCPPLVTFDDVVLRLPRHRGNLREALFELYDLYEQRRRSPR